MNKEIGLVRRYAAALVALAVVVTCFAFSQYPRLGDQEARQLASRFHFSKHSLPEVPDHPPYKHVRDVHPSMKRISAWVSSLGASATLADFDGDGLPNDLCYADPRTDLVTLTPAPGTPERYAPFVLDPAPLPLDQATTAAMGMVAGDYNEDGLMDIMVYYWGRAPLLFLRAKPGPNTGPVALNRAAYVARELADASERWFSNGAVHADLDGDGHMDLIVGNYFQDGAHILDAHAGGVEVMHEGKSKALNGGRKHLYLWKGATTGTDPTVQFEEVKHVLPEEINRGWTLAIGAADLDGDLLPEVYFSFDFGPDRLLHNRSTPGRLAFAPLMGKRALTTPKSCVLGADSFKGMGCDFGDVNGDGYLDIYVSNIATKFGLTESHFLWLSTGEIDAMKDGRAPYVHGSEKLGLSRSGWGWESRLADFDNDGVLEAIQACGFVKGTVNRWPELQSLGTSNDQIVHNPKLWPSFTPGTDLSGHDTNPFFVRAADGRYYDIASYLGLDVPMVTKGIATADVDGDGRLDFVLANQWEPFFYFHNEAPKPGAFIGLHLLLPVEGRHLTGVQVREGHPDASLMGRPAIGASVRIPLPDGRALVSQVDGGAGHSGRRSPDIHLGLGMIAADTALPVEIRWRDIQGQPQQTILPLKPGWHSVLLGSTSTQLTQSH